MEVSEANPSEEAAKPVVTKPAEENPAALNEYVKLGLATGIVAVGVELLTNEFETKRMEAIGADFVDRLSMEKVGLAIGKGVLGYFAYNNRAKIVDSSVGLGVSLGLFVSAVADVVEVIGWQKDKA